MQSSPGPIERQPTFYQPDFQQSRTSYVNRESLLPLQDYSSDKVSTIKPPLWSKLIPGPRFAEGMKSVGIKALWGLGAAACGALALATAPIQVIGVGIAAIALFSLVTSSNEDSAKHASIIGLCGLAIAAPIVGTSLCLVELAGKKPIAWVKEELNKSQQPQPRPPHQGYYS